MHKSLNTQCFGFKFSVIVFIVWGYIIGLKAIWILFPSMGFCSQKEIDEKQGFRVTDSSIDFLRAIQMIRLLLGKKTTSHSDFIISDGEEWA